MARAGQIIIIIIYLFSYSWYMYMQSNNIVRGPGAEPGKWVQSFFLNVFIFYRYCTL